MNFIQMASGIRQDMTFSQKKKKKNLFFPTVMMIVVNAFLLKKVRPYESRQK